MKVTSERLPSARSQAVLSKRLSPRCVQAQGSNRKLRQGFEVSKRSDGCNLPKLSVAKVAIRFLPQSKRGATHFSPHGSPLPSSAQFLPPGPRWCPTNSLQKLRHVNLGHMGWFGFGGRKPAGEESSASPSVASTDDSNTPSGMGDL